MCAVPSQRRPPLYALTGARFFAALSVVIGHYLQHFRASSNVLATTANLAPAAVTFFYLLSGFVLAYTYSDKLFSVEAFAQARFARIYPTYLLGLLLGTVGMSAWGLRSAVAWAVNALALQSWVPLRTFHIFNSPAWSISCEAFFYACFPFLLKFAVQNGAKALSMAIGAFLLEGILFGAGIGVVPTVIHLFHWDIPLAVAADLLVYRMPPFRLGEFFIGICLALWFRTSRQWNASQCNRAICIGLVFLIVVIWFSPVKASYTTPWNAMLFFWVFIPGFSLMLLALAHGRGVLSRVLALPYIVLLGEASYALYILHEPLLRLGYKLNLPSLVSFAATIGLSIVCFLWYEKPARTVLRQWKSVRPAGSLHQAPS